jgi:hypothetical protein
MTTFEDGNLRRLPGQLKDRLAKVVRDVDLDHLPIVTLPNRATPNEKGAA